MVGQNRVFRLKQLATSKRSRLAASIAAGGLVLASMPTAGFALGALDQRVSLPATGSFAALTPASVDPRLAALLAKRSNGRALLMRFTPAGVAERASRSVTVAIRIDEDAARAISVRSAIAAAQDQVAAASSVRIAPTRYNLGLSRGYQSFAKAPELSRSLSDADIPNLAEFRPSPGVRPDESRFAARIALEEQAKAGASPRTIDSRSDQAVDVAGSYRPDPQPRRHRRGALLAGARPPRAGGRDQPAGQPGGLRRNPVPLLGRSCSDQQGPRFGGVFSLPPATGPRRKALSTQCNNRG
jgi:hypothetical protein